MRCTVVLEFDASEAGQPARRVELMRLHRDTASPSPSDVGVAIEEGKTLLLAVQQEIVVEQIARSAEGNPAVVSIGFSIGAESVKNLASLLYPANLTRHKRRRLQLSPSTYATSL